MGLSNFCQRQPLSGVYAKVAIIVGIANNYGDVSTALDMTGGVHTALANNVFSESGRSYL